MASAVKAPREMRGGSEAYLMPLKNLAGTCEFHTLLGSCCELTSICLCAVWRLRLYGS